MPEVAAQPRETLVVETNSLSALEHAYALFTPHIPPNTVLTIEETDGRLIEKYIVRLQYTSAKSGRKISLTAKGHCLPLSELDCMLRFYLIQLVLTPNEVARRFSNLAWMEKRARRDAFLAGDRSVMVSIRGGEDDRLPYEGGYI